ncbi:hypothetical protein [Lacinutrix sp.]|uniref:hypothetical protein n=1 Tax=Lacinutrix sp. TaxID=1937692 RepID=UPI00261D2ED2|nr:hypothetical protein [Lacinutrix sp.]MDG1715029.1 hypothetical protein [Lacinutrix sp.]
MKLFKKAALQLVILLFVSSCGKEKKSNTKDIVIEEEKTEAVTSKPKSKICKIFIKGIFPQNDSFELFFSELATTPFSQENTISRGFEGKKEVQELVFDLIDFYPEKIRLDLGSNSNMKEIYLEEILINYDEETLIIDASNFIQYFTNNQFISFGENNKIILKVITTNEKKSYDPYLVSTPLLIKELVRL